MKKNALHITNGSSLTNYLRELDFKEDIITWHEMLCEGNTYSILDSKQFLNQRKAFLNTYYDIEFDEQLYHKELNVLDNIDNYNKIILWFEYDLFCHINLIAIVSLLKEKQIKIPIYLVCSGRVEGETQLKGLSELSRNVLLRHYSNKIQLTSDDIDLAQDIWRTYCGKDHNLLKPFITKKSSFQYLNSCLKAHLKRFPNLKNGLSDLEENILKIVKDNDIKSRHHLLGYALNYQGYYGFGDIQINRIINNLEIFFNESEEKITLNRKGYEALHGQSNFALEINNNIPFGGVNRLDFYFSNDDNKLIKNPIPCQLKSLNLY